MNRLRHRLRFQLALTFALFGAAIILLLSSGLYLTAHNLSLRLMDETLSAEIEDYYARLDRNPDARLPATLSIRGYIHPPGQASAGMPSELVELRHGSYQMELDGDPYRIMVVDKNGQRLVMLFNATPQKQRELAFLMQVVLGALIMTLLSAWIGWWLAGRIVSPISELARRVSQATPGQDEQQISHGFADNEIGMLAQVFEGYLKRMRAFIERETAFTADVSHELRTPQAIVQGVVELMQEDPSLNERQQQRVERIRRANHQMTEITAALLLMAREPDHEALANASCDVWSVVNEVIEAHRHLVKPDVILSTVCRHRLQLSVESTLLSIVIANLVRNAMAHTSNGEIAVTLDKDSLVVRDTGSGISRETLEKVFERHYKGEGSAGSGIGLSMVKRICERYDWRIALASSPGEGTTASLLFAND